MMEAGAKLRYLRVSPRKVRLLADLIRGLPLREAKLQLSSQSKRSAGPLLKLLKSAESNAKHNFKLNTDDLCVKEIKVDGGRMLKRYMPKARGRATIIRKRTSHISVVLGEKPGTKKKK